jgi:DNA-binding MarR family transcriptional regulator
MTDPRPTSVAEEIGQRIPFRSVGQEAMVALLRTADDLRRHLADRLAAEDLTLQQYNVLRILRGAGERGLPTLEIGGRMVERQPGVTRLVDRLIAKELVTRQRGRRDRRQVLCRITPAGLELLARLDDTIGRADTDIVAMLSEDRVQDLVELLDLLRAGLRDADGG